MEELESGENNEMIYALSDIHGCLDALEDALAHIGDLAEILSDDSENLLIFLGDYVDGGSDSAATLRRIYDIQQRYPGHVVVLKGNHDEWLLDFLTTDEPILTTNYTSETLTSFLPESSTKFLPKCNLEENLIQIRHYILVHYSWLVPWLESMPLYFKTKTQVFVHAGIDEDAGELWELGTSEDVMLNKYPPTTGPFLIDVIAGHNGSCQLAEDPDFHGVYFDGKSHYFIDGTVLISHRIPVLTYDITTGKYSSL
ncbi:metallophosphoesterase [Arcanobacterium hippocoleae]